MSPPPPKKDAAGVGRTRGNLLRDRESWAKKGPVFWSMMVVTVIVVAMVVVMVGRSRATAQIKNMIDIGIH